MDGITIENILRKDPKCSKMFVGVFACNRLPKWLNTDRPSLLVCNTDTYGQPGIHWIVIYIESSEYGEFFDSLGRQPDVPFRTFLHKYCSRWSYINRQIQSLISRFCGHYSVFYALHRSRGLNISAVCNKFTNDTALNDYLVHKFFHDINK
jgi:hypothetical protein